MKHPGNASMILFRVQKVPFLLLEIVFAIFVCEIVVMLAMLDFAPVVGGAFEAILDAVLLSSLTGPVILWRFLDALKEIETSIPIAQRHFVTPVLGRKVHVDFGAANTISNPLVYLTTVLALGRLVFSIVLTDSDILNDSRTVELVSPQNHTDINTSSTDQRNEVDSHSSSADSSRRKRILLAENSPNNQRFIKWMLERKFVADVALVEDGAQAVAEELKTLVDEPFDLVLMGDQMPISDGLSATKRLRQQQLTVPIFALTAQSTSTDVDSSIETGGNLHHSKPIDWEKLKVALQSVDRIAPQDQAVSLNDGQL